MQRGPITAILAGVFYAGLLYWASAWRASDAGEELAANAKPTAATLDQSATLQPAEASNLPLTSTQAMPEAAPPEPVELAAAEFAAEQAPDGSWEIGGQFATQEAADAIQRAFGTNGNTVLGELAASAEVAHAPWSDALAGWIPMQSAAGIRNSGLGVIDGQLLIAGDIATADAREALLDAAEQHFANSGLEIVGEIEVVPPSEPAEFALVPGENSGYQIAGQLADAKLKSRMVELIGEITGGAAVEDNVLVADNIGKAPWGQSMLRVLPALLVEVSEPQIMASAGGFLMAGSVPTESTRDAIAQMVEQSFADTPVSVDNQLTIAAIAEPASLSISRDEAGTLTISGQLPEGAQFESLIAKARAASTEDKPPAELIDTAANTGPAPWLADMEKLVGPFATSARWGALSVHGDQVALEAEVGDPETADVLTALVENAFPEPEFKCIVEISVTAPAGPSDEDISALEKIIADTVIYFDSNSDELSPAGRTAAESLAAAMEKVPGSGIALLGHADKHGSAAYNRELSERRCAAVRAALEEQGIESLLIEVEVLGESDARADRGKTYESARRVEFELR